MGEKHNIIVIIILSHYGSTIREKIKKNCGKDIVRTHAPKQMIFLVV